MNRLQSPLNILVHWITEREAIHERKMAGEPLPWTTDPILREWRFCNVNRCDDFETRWIFDHVVLDHLNSKTIWFNLAIARFINWSPALAKIGYFEEWDRQQFITAVTVILDRGEKVYTGAYMVPAGAVGIPKHFFLADKVFGPLWALRNEIPQEFSCLAWDTFFRRIHGMGDFLRNQIITDMKYSPHLPYEFTNDWQSFVLAGPGTQRGLNRILGRPLSQGWNQQAAARMLINLREQLQQRNVLAHVPYTFDDLNNLSNCMCEFDKYCRVLFNEGKPRSRYTPRAQSSS